MTATDELRRLLDERGVEWWEATPCKTKWNSPIIGGPVAAREWNGEMVLDTGYIAVTPAQAIDATLGRGTCRDLAETPDYRYKTQFECSECGYEYSSVGGFGCDYGDEPDFRYCPNCGRRVVECD